MSIDALNTITNWGYFVVIAIVPAALYCRLRPRRRWLWSVFLSVVSGWVLLVAYRAATYSITVTHMMLHARPGEAAGYDGASGSLGILILGWIPPLISVLITAVVRYWFRSLRGETYDDR